MDLFHHLDTLLSDDDLVVGNLSSSQQQAKGLDGAKVRGLGGLFSAQSPLVVGLGAPTLADLNEEGETSSSSTSSLYSERYQPVIGQGHGGKGTLWSLVTMTMLKPNLKS
jgi:hypothetical protein